MTAISIPDSNNSGTISAVILAPHPPDADYGLLGSGPAVGTSSASVDSGAYTGGTHDPVPVAEGRGGVYIGSLSAQGSMVAMQLNSGTYQYKTVVYGSTEWTALMKSIIDALTQQILPSEFPLTVVTPYLTGYMRQYWKNPTTCTFGNDSPIPALTGVVPAKFTSIPGNLQYYIDLQLTRISGSNYFDIFHFLNTFNQSISWVSTANNYIASLSQAQDTNLAYYGSADYKSFISQGFNKYKKGSALITAIRNQGQMTSTLRDGHFGTPNAVVKSLVIYGLGYINNLSASLAANGVTLDNIYDDSYTQLCTSLLSAITNADDLATIQGVLESTIPHITNPLAYCSIEGSGGLPNDSAFKDLAEFGADIMEKAPNLNIASGAALASLINDVQIEVSASVESLATNDSLIPQSVIDTLRANLPTNGANTPVSVLNTIGSAAGFLTGQMAKVNNGIAALHATAYGPRIRAVLSEISRCTARVPLNKSEETAALRSPDGGTTYWLEKQDQKIVEYYNILNEVASDSSENIQNIFNTINTNYDKLCTAIDQEIANFARANATTATFKDNSQLLTFVQSLPSLTADTSNIGTDTILYGMIQPNSAGDLVKAVMGQSKNNQLLGDAGVRLLGQI